MISSMTVDHKGAAPSDTTWHDNLYTTLLGVLAFVLLMSMATVVWLRLQPTTPADAKTVFYS